MGGGRVQTIGDRMAIAASIERLSAPARVRIPWATRLDPKVHVLDRWDLEDARGYDRDPTAEYHPAFARHLPGRTDPDLSSLAALSCRFYEALAEERIARAREILAQIRRWRYRAGNQRRVRED